MINNFGKMILTQPIIDIVNDRYFSSKIEADKYYGCDICVDNIKYRYANHIEKKIATAIEGNIIHMLEDFIQSIQKNTDILRSEINTMYREFCVKNKISSKGKKMLYAELLRNGFTIRRTASGIYMVRL